ncbi:hypothetical protein [Ancylobacter polymorphus]|uniref:Uncharacterized protein n=1 Tax=Ancylobacter polymorphus TaxID=223390 RepID=A0A9E6ZQ96_9HYPH|nr:hypothetical protein [Ancylobacter polymorphus]UOK69761.1 hypothetical protein K9D25_13505 [Ancylobacter polymorphus]
MEHPNNGYGVSGGTGGTNPERKPEGATAQPTMIGANASKGPRDPGSRSTASLFPPRLYSFQALVAMGVLGFMVGRICR